jgi:Radical SAM superfamily/4Fe-4S single cluster domain
VTDHLDRLRALSRNGETTSELARGTTPVLVVSASAGPDAGAEALEPLFEALRRRCSREQVRALGLDRGYRLEDAEALVAGVPERLDAPSVKDWLLRRLATGTQLEVVRAGRLTLASVIAPRFGRPPSLARYERDDDGRVRVEAFELHVVEHCNLRCANCCNMSPLVGRRVLQASDVERICRRLAPALVADVVKIMGGEPLLHPDIVSVLGALRASGIGKRVRLFTNGLLLNSVPEAFWDALEDLTISNYSSAPLKPGILELARERARRHGFVLNVKPVGEFSQVLSPRFERDSERTRATFNGCWLRHRCLVARRGRFFMCTRAAYADEFLHSVEHEPPPDGMVLDRSEDGIAIDAPDLAARIERYLNREQPLGACRYCFGGDGRTEAHYQLTRDEVRRGVISRALRLSET